MIKKLVKSTLIIGGVGVGVGALIVIFGLFGRGFIKASDAKPNSVAASEISEHTARISWVTDQESEGVVEYGTDPTSLIFFAPETEKTTSHSVDLTLLSPGQVYYFRIKIGDTSYDDGGKPWTFTTTQDASSPSLSTQEEENVPVESVNDFASCEIEKDCENIKAKIQTGECLAIHYSKCISETNSL